MAADDIADDATSSACERRSGPVSGGACPAVVGEQRLAALGQVTFVDE